MELPEGLQGQEQLLEFPLVCRRARWLPAWGEPPGQVPLQRARVQQQLELRQLSLA